MVSLQMLRAMCITSSRSLCGELCRSSKKLAGPGATAYLGDQETTQIEEIYYEEDSSTIVRQLPLLQPRLFGQCMLKLAVDAAVHCGVDLAGRRRRSSSCSIHSSTVGYDL